MTMLKRIEQAISALVQEKSIRVLFAIESGSRAWGFPSADSDYDVRIIYCHAPEWYLSIFDKRDVIEKPITDELDMSGWELRKALRLLHTNNAVMHEWLNSPIIYQQDAHALTQLQQLAAATFNSRPVFHHYLSMSAKKFDLGDDENFSAKRFLYAFRTLLCSLWIEKYHTAPPMLFQQLVEDLLGQEPQIREQLAQLITAKAQGLEADAIPSPDLALSFASSQITRLKQITIPNTQPRQTACFDKLFNDLIFQR